MRNLGIAKPLLTFIVTAVLIISLTYLLLHTTYLDSADTDTVKVATDKIKDTQPERSSVEKPECVEHNRHKEHPPERQFVVSITAEEHEWLCRLVSAESRGESLEGQIAVANVVLNRVASPLFPNTVKAVIFQRGQFCPVRNGSIHKEPTEQSRKAVRMALEGHRAVSQDALYFYAPRMVSRGSWIRTRKVIKQIGVHNFATQKRSR